MKGRIHLARVGVVVCCLAAMLFTACNTARGVGRDTQAVGRSIERAAK
jgi:predicted small secreted protein